MSIKSKAIFILFIFVVHELRLCKSTISPDPSQMLDGVQHHLGKLYASMDSKVAESPTAVELSGDYLNRLPFLASVINLEANVANAMLLPKIDNQMQKLIVLIREIDKSIGHQDSRLTLIKLKEALGVAKVIFGMLRDAIGSANEWNKLLVVIGVIAGSAAVAGIAATVSGGAGIFTLAGFGMVTLTTVTAGVAFGAWYIYNLYANRIDLEGKMRYRELQTKIIRIRSMAKQLCDSGKEEVYSFIEKLDAFEKVIEANL